MTPSRPRHAEARLGAGALSGPRRNRRARAIALAAASAAEVENLPMITGLDHLVALGTMTIFYVPSNKLDDARYFGDGRTARTLIHESLMQRFQAYTQTPTPVKGYWVAPDGLVVHDVMERFEVSFNSEEEFQWIIGFLVDLCGTLDEQSIYVTRGDCSYLVRRHAAAPPSTA